MFNVVNKGNFSTHTHKFTERKVFAESGRSMVEMLGALAIIGILSMVGIKAFNAGMTQHRANELLNEAQKRAVVVATQIMAGREKNALSVAEFPNPDGYTFGVEANTKNEKQFNITITGVAGDVCQKMKNMVDEGTAVRIVSELCDKLTFNDDLSKTFYLTDYTTKLECISNGKTWCSGRETCSEGNCCAEFDQNPTSCQKCDMESGAVLVSLANDIPCSTDEITDGYCHNGVCLEKSTDINCLAGGVICHDSNLNDDCCPEGYFCTTNGDKSGKCIKFGSDSECTINDDCKIKYSDGSKPFCEISFTGSGAGAVPSSGKCTPLSEKFEPIEDTVIGLGSIVISTGSMNFWNARNWCQALPGNKTLISMEDIQCYKNGVSLCRTTGQSGLCYCCASNKECPQSSWSSKWTTDENGSQIISEADERLYSPVIVALRKKYYNSPKNYIWTASDNASNNGTRIQLINGYFDNGTRSGNGYALCK